MKQFSGGYILDNLVQLFNIKDDSSKFDAVKNLSQWLTYFTVESKSGFEENSIEYSPSVAVLINILERGEPTRLNKFALDKIIGSFNFIEIDKGNESSIVVNYKNINDDFKELLFRSFHIIDPRLKKEDLEQEYQKSWERLGSNYEEKFLYEKLPSTFKESGDFIIQLLTPQRSITSIIKASQELENFNNDIQNNFSDQRTDFSIEFPYGGNNKGVVLEIDGSQHELPSQEVLDTERDKAVAYSNWNNTVRIKTSYFETPDFDRRINIFKHAINNPFILNCYYNYRHPIWDSHDGQQALEMSLTPFGIARIQRVILEAIAQNILELTADKWEIAILERDVPCGKLAIEDLKELIKNLNNLNDKKITLPEIELQVFSTKEFIKSTFHGNDIKNITDLKSDKHYHLLIDIAVLSRNLVSSKLFSNSDEIITIRSVHYRDCKKKVKTTELINYKPFCINNRDSGKWIVENEVVERSLEYLLQSIFRKWKFREGQLPIMHNALQGKSVIGLLPTGGGKSLTYQLSALLQPGICLVIDPIRSLMKDQVDGLTRNNIHSCLYINSKLQGEQKRKALKRMVEGQVQFVFISPERLQMADFRDVLSKMFEEKLFFSYCVIDEAHCVSEWGHDFRTAYLRLGENAMKFCKTKNKAIIKLFGLTATASYDVLADVQRELSGNDESKRLTEEAIVRSEYSKRHELQYGIEPITFNTAGIKDIWVLKKRIGEAKQNRVKQLMDEIPETLMAFQNKPTSIFDESEWHKNENNEHESYEKMLLGEHVYSNFYKNGHAALIFCPHKSGIFGVTDKFKTDKHGNPKFPRVGYYDKLSEIEDIRAGYFMGSGDDRDLSKEIEEESFNNQDRFISNKLNLMVATKAFGMGIDKENIRYTIHLNYPSSIESFVQEAGRAGRDKKIATSYILFNDSIVKLTDDDKKIEYDLDINMFFHKNSFKSEEKEWAVLDELLTEIYFPDRSFRIESKINAELDEEVKCVYWETDGFHGIFFNKGFGKKLGYINLDTLKSSLKDTVDVNLSKLIFKITYDYIGSEAPKVPLKDWIQTTEKEIGIEEILKSKKIGEEFSITIGFYNNTKERVETLTKWLKKVIHKFFEEATVLKMRKNSPSALEFIEQIEEKYEKSTGGKLNFENTCKRRDIEKGKNSGTTKREFEAYYNGYRDKLDTEKAIFRLSTLGIIDDYTINFSANTFTLTGTKKSEQEYRKNLKDYLLKYYSEKFTNSKLIQLDKIDEPNLLRKLLRFLIVFVYKEIEQKRKLAIHDMKEACRYGIDQGEKANVRLKEFIDLYFNSKYARSEYHYESETGELVHASLTDISDSGKEYNIEWVWRFMKIVEEDPKGSEIDNTKHLRGACMRLLRSNPTNYTFLLLQAFSLYMIEYKNPRYLQEAEGLLIDAFLNMQKLEENWTEKQLEDVFDEFVKRIKDKNGEIEKYMTNSGFSFDFENIMISRYLEPLSEAKHTIKSLNSILN